MLFTSGFYYKIMKKTKNVNKIPSLLQASFFQKVPKSPQQVQRSPESVPKKSITGGVHFFQRQLFDPSRFGGVVHQLQPGKDGGICGICDIKIPRGLSQKGITSVPIVTVSVY